MLRYKVYAVVTHPKFPKYAFYVSGFLYIAAIYVLFNPSLISIKPFISDGAVVPGHQGSQITNYISSTSFKDFTQWENSNIYYAYIKAQRSTGTDCNALLFTYSSSKIGIQLAISLKRYLEAQIWGGDLLLVLYKPEPYAAEFRRWMQWSSGRFGVIRAFYDIDIDESSSYFSVSGDGLNGIQTDQDLIFSITQLLQKCSLDVRYPTPFMKTPVPSMSYSMSSWKSIAQGNIHNPHAYLLQSGYISIKVYTVSTSRSSTTNSYMLLKFLELLVRMISSLEENLHHGFYFYYFSSPSDMIPLSRYSYLLGAMILPIFLQALSILKEKWWDSKAALLLLLPYFTCFAAYYTVLNNCNSVFHWYGLAILLVNIFAKGSNQIFKAYSNYSLILSIAFMSIRNFPIALLLSALVPIKVFLPPVKLRSMFYLLGALAIAGISYAPVETLASIEACSGHHVLYYALCIVAPCIWHLVYLFN